MKRNIAIFSTLLITSIIIGVVSCTKKESPPTPYTMIQGRWKLVAIAIDNNGNGVVDEGEKTQVVSSAQNQHLIFNADLTGTITNVSDSVSSPVIGFDWNIVNTDSLFTVSVGHDSTTYYIVDISTGILTLEENITSTAPALSWYYYNKD